jgi:hypothetical protein
VFTTESTAPIDDATVPMMIKKTKKKKTKMQQIQKQTNRNIAEEMLIL